MVELAPFCYTHCELFSVVQLAGLYVVGSLPLAHSAVHSPKIYQVAKLIIFLLQCNLTVSIQITGSFLRVVVSTESALSCSSLSLSSPQKKFLSLLSITKAECPLLSNHVV